MEIVILEIVISLLLTVISYLIFPICYRYKNGKVSEKKGKKLALWNSIICEAIFTIGGFAIGVESSTNGTLFAQGFLYYFIAKKILVDYSIPEKQQEIEEKNERISTSKNCGVQTFSDEEKCSNCQADNHSSKKKLNESVDDEEIDEEDKNIVEVDDMVELNTGNFTVDQSTIKTDKMQFPQIGLIKKLQIAVLSVVCVLVLFSVIYPITVSAICSSKIPPITKYKSIQLTKLDANQKVYCEMRGSYSYLYVNYPEKIVVYRFYNSTMYNSKSAVLIGYATSSQLKSYFGSNIYSGKPSISFIAPAVAPIGIIIGVLMLTSIIILSYFIHKYSKEVIFYLTKKDEEFIALKNDFKNEDISKYGYQKNIKALFSRKILKDNQLFKIFKFLY